MLAACSLAWAKNFPPGDATDEGFQTPHSAGKVPCLVPGVKTGGHGFREQRLENQRLAGLHPRMVEKGQDSSLVPADRFGGILIAAEDEVW